MKILKSFLPSFLWMVFIFFLSSRAKVSLTPISLIDFIIFKSLHMIEYAVLFFFNYQGIRKSFFLEKRKIFIWAFILTTLYAVSDEIHQSFVPTREGKIRDVGFDALGALVCGWFLWKLTLNLQKRPKN